jgi:hypothetical protein
MKISGRTVKRLGEIITGDKGVSPYRGGPKLVTFFNECGARSRYSSRETGVAGLSHGILYGTPKTSNPVSD